MKGKIFNAQEHFEQQYLQQYIGLDIGKDVSKNHYPEYRHRKTGKIVEAEYAKAYHGEWLFLGQKSSGKRAYGYGSQMVQRRI